MLGMALTLLCTLIPSNNPNARPRAGAVRAAPPHGGRGEGARALRGEERRGEAKRRASGAQARCRGLRRAARRRAAASAAAAAAAMIAKFYSNHNQRLVLLGTLVGLGLSAVPFAFKDVRRVEQRVQQRALGSCAVAGRVRSRSALGAAAEAPARARTRADTDADWPRALLPHSIPRHPTTRHPRPICARLSLRRLSHAPSCATRAPQRSKTAKRCATRG